MSKVKKQKGGKILGQGRDGCVTDPPYLCSNKYDPKNHVSKLIDLTKVSKKQIAEEFKLGQIFLKSDPKHKYFLPYVDGCQYTISKTVNDKKWNDIKKCGYVHGGKFDIMSLILPKGSALKLDHLKMQDKLITIHQCAKIVHKVVHELNLVHLDIKQDNMLLYDGHATLIDFTPDFVFPLTQKKFDEFGDWFGRGFYFAWPPELYIMTHILRNNFYGDSFNNDHMLEKDLLKKFKKVFKMDFFDKNYAQKLIEFYNQDFALFIDKIMMYSIGIALEDAFGTKKANPAILQSLTDIEYEYRSSSAEIIKLLDPFVEKKRLDRAMRKAEKAEKTKKLVPRPKDPSLPPPVPPMPKSLSPRTARPKPVVKSQLTPLPKTPSLPKTPLPKTPSPPKTPVMKTPSLTQLKSKTKKELLSIIKKYKSGNCPPVSKLSETELKKSLKKLDGKYDSSKKSKSQLKKDLVSIKKQRCSVLKTNNKKEDIIKQMVKLNLV